MYLKGKTLNLEELKTYITENLMNLDPIFLVSIIMGLLFLLYWSNRRSQKKAPDETDQAKKLLEKVFNISDESFFVLSPTYQVVYANDLIIKLLGLKPGDTYKKIFQSIKVKVKRDWSTLDVLIESKLVKSENNTYDLMQTQLCIQDKDTNK